MAFTSNPSGFHHEQSQRYVEQNGRWIRAGVKGLPVHTEFKALANASATGGWALISGGARKAENKIIVDCGFIPSAKKQMYLALWDWDLGAIDLSDAKYQHDSKINAWWGTNCLSVRDYYSSHRPNSTDGVPLLWTGELPQQETPVHAHIEILRSVNGWLRLEWLIKFMERDNTTVDLEGSASMNLDVSHIGYLGLSWADDITLRNAGMHTQWW